MMQQAMLQQRAEKEQLSDQVETLQMALEALNDELTEVMYAEGTEASVQDAEALQIHRAEKQQLQEEQASQLRAKDEKCRDLTAQIQALNDNKLSEHESEITKEATPLGLERIQQQHESTESNERIDEDSAETQHREALVANHEEQIKELHEQVMLLQQSGLQHRAEKRQWELAQTSQIEAKDAQINALTEQLTGLNEHVENLLGASKDASATALQECAQLQAKDDHIRSLHQALKDEAMEAQLTEAQKIGFADHIRVLNEQVMLLQQASLRHRTEKQQWQRECDNAKAQLEEATMELAAPADLLAKTDGEVKMSQSLQAIQIKMDLKQLKKGVVKLRQHISRTAADLIEAQAERADEGLGAGLTRADKRVSKLEGQSRTRAHELDEVMQDLSAAKGELMAPLEDDAAEEKAAQEKAAADEAALMSTQQLLRRLKSAQEQTAAVEARPLLLHKPALAKRRAEEKPPEMPLDESLVITEVGIPTRAADVKVLTLQEIMLEKMMAL